MSNSKILEIRSPHFERLGLGCCGTERPGKGGREPALTSQQGRTSEQARQRPTQGRAIPLLLSQPLSMLQHSLSSSNPVLVRRQKSDKGHPEHFCQIQYLFLARNVSGEMQKHPTCKNILGPPRPTNARKRYSLIDTSILHITQPLTCERDCTIAVPIVVRSCF